MKRNIFIYCLLSTCILFLWSCQSDNKIEFNQYKDQVDVMVNKNLIATYHFGHHLSKPVLNPVLSPFGDTVTRGFPFTIIEGESRGHPWQNGVYFAYGHEGEVNGNSFWSLPQERPPDAELPQIRQDKILEIKGGRSKGKIKTLNLWVDSTNKPILEENRVIDFYVLEEDEYKIDFTIQLKAIDTTVIFKDTKEGMFAIRVADWLAENARGTLHQSTGEYLNAHGKKTESNIWGRRSEWVRLEGDKDGRKIGVAIFHHPHSVNYPTYWHARGYGLFSANPLGQYDFQKDMGYEVPQHFSLKLNPGESAMFKFRMVIYEGARKKEQFDQEFINFSKD